MNKTAIKNFAISARRKLIAMAIDKAGIIGITKETVAEPTSRGGDFAVFPTHFGTETRLDGAQLRQRENLVHQITEKGYDSVMEEVAYTWFNRLIAVRFMEVNDYLPTRVRVLSSETAGKAEPDLVTLAPNVELGFTSTEVEEIYALKDDPRKSGELFKKLFIKQCNALGEILPELFEQTADYTELLLDLSWDKEDSVVRELLTIDEGDFLEAVEIIGWMYQYYNTEPKQKVFDGLKKNVKITKENIPAATQLFTPDWIVRYMVENSLGRSVINNLHYDIWADEEKAKIDVLKSKWKYYLDEAMQTPEVDTELRILEHNKFASGIKQPFVDYTLIDPCMGSGHILVYAFEVFMDIYRAQGWTEKDAAQRILEKNLYGLDIDKRAYQLSYFALMMKARGYDRRFFGRGVAPQVYCPMGYPDGEEYGSLLLVDELEPKPDPQLGQMSLDDMHYEEKLNAWNFRRLLAQKYDVVVTNPPYMGASNGSGKLNDYIKKHFPDSKADLFACFIGRCGQMTKPNCYTAMITQHSWMFLSSFEKLRAKLLQMDTVNMAHLGARAFDEIGGEVVQTTSFVLRKSHIKNYKGVYCRLIEPTTQKGKEDMFLAAENRYESAQDNFSKIPGSPIAYWVSKDVIAAYDCGHMLGDLSYPKTGMTTGDNNRFLRLWTEVVFGRCCFTANSSQDAKNSLSKWFPYCKGGGFKRWYGYNEYLVNWENDGYEIKNNIKDNGLKAASVRSESLYFKSLVTWSAVTTGKFSCRSVASGFLFDSGGSSIAINKNKLYILAFLNSVLGQYYLDISNATINYQPGDIAGMPIIEQSVDQVERLAEQNISISKTDWDSDETSWDFKRHPLLK